MDTSINAGGAIPAANPNQRSFVARLAKQYPLVGIAAFGLVVGTVLRLLDLPEARFAFAAVAIGGGVPLILSTIKSLLRGRFSVDLIAMLAIVGAILQGQFVAGAVVVLMQSGGEALEDYGMRRANRSLDQLLRRAPGTALQRSGSEFLETRAADLQIGDVILIRPGAIIAADGIVTEGEGSVDESALTGEPVPLGKRAGDQVFSGTINLRGVYQVRITSTAAESHYERIVRMVQKAQGERAPVQRLADRYSLPFTLLTLASAAGLWLAAHDPIRALSVLVVATPCPLLIATPLAVLSAVNRAASLNIIVKSGAALERAAAVTTVVFDKTGTLTVGNPELEELRPLGGSSSGDADRFLALAASVELLSTNVLAAAVVRLARSRALTLDTAVEVVEAPGTGISGVVNGRRIAIGSGGFVRAAGASIPEECAAEVVQLRQDGRAVAYMAIDSSVAALLLFGDRIRPEALHLLQRLQKAGVERVVMLTGDAPETAAAVAKVVGITDARTRLTPQEKLEAVRALGRAHPTMMVGDGINDAPALAAAPIGVAMGHYGAGIATDAADVVITVENVERVADVILVGQRMLSVAKQGILFGMGGSMVLMLLAGLGYIPPTAGALLQELLDLAAILNALRAR